MKKKVGRKPTGKYAYLNNLPVVDPYNPMESGVTNGQIAKAIKTPIRIGIMSDFFSMGIFCSKAGLEGYARQKFKSLKDAKKNRQFTKGINEADQYSFDDISMEMSEIRDYSPIIFDAYISQVAGEDIVNQIIEAINRAKENPWESLNQIECGFKRNNKSIFINGIGRPDACRKNSPLRVAS